MSAPAEGPNAEQLKRSLELQTLLNSITERIHEAESFAEVLPGIEPDMLRILRGERMTVYQRSRNEQEIVSKFKSGAEIKEIRVPLSTTSIAGYVALTQQPIRIDDVYDADALKAIHPNLQFNISFDKQTGYRTRSMVVVPIKHKDVMLGVLQVLNRVGGGSFTDIDLRNALKMGAIIGQKFRYDFQGTNGPYDHLILKKKLTQEELNGYIQRAPKERTNVAHLLITEGHISAEEVGASLEHYYQVPFMSYDPNLEVPRELIKGVNEAYLQRQLWVPVSGNAEEVVILIDNPTDTQRIMEVQRVVQAAKYVFKVGLPDDILRYLGVEVGGADDGVGLDDLLGRMEDEVGEDITESVEDESSENDATIIQLVNKIIMEAYKQNTSDIHIEPNKGKAPADVRFRVDGVCRRALQIPATHIRPVVARIKIMSGLDISERRKPQDGKCAVRFKGKPVELRVATLPTVHGESAVLRILAASKPLPLGAMGLNERNNRLTHDLTSHPHGIFLVVGPTGSGKTTTLHAVLGNINDPGRKIWTAEDPVEITQPGLQQVQVLPKIGFTFAAALRSFLRADPDVIMIGEMRDKETAHAGVEASLTGHLVFSTLHTNSAPETVTRLLDMEIDPISFADALLGVLAQRLMRTLCKECKSPYHGSAEEHRFLKLHYGEQHWDELHIVDPTPGAEGQLVSEEEMKQELAKLAILKEIREALAEGKVLVEDANGKRVALRPDELEKVKGQVTPVDPRLTFILHKGTGIKGGRPCEKCGGSGRVGKEECSACAGHGVTGGSSCPNCGGSGYKGRMGIHELLENNQHMREMIYRKATAAEIQAQAMSDGMRTLMQDGIAKVLQGMSDFEQLQRVVAG
ncbi:GspE/PulE family protein [Endothiovibrio diazotrophicus]